MLKMRKGTKTGILSTVVLLGISFLCAPVWAGSFTADISEEVLNNKLIGKIMVRNKQYRMDLRMRDKEEEGTRTVIVDRQNGWTWLINPQTKTYKEIKNATFLAYMADPFQSIEKLEEIAKKKKVGTETIAGYTCDRYGYYDQEFKLADVWFAEKLQSFPVKVHMVSGRKDGSIQVKTNWGDTRIALSNIKEGPVDAALFAIPLGFTKELDPAEARKKAVAALPAVSGTLKGTAPWGRRITTGGEIQVKVDPQRPVRITLRNLINEAAGSYTIYKKGASKEGAQSKPFTFQKKWESKKIEISRDKKSEWVFIRVGKGLVYATVINEKDPFTFSRDRQLEEGYLTDNSSRGLIVYQDRKLTITITGDNQDAPTSEVTVTGYRDDYKNKVLEKKVVLANAETRKWEFPSGHQMKTCEISVGKSGGIKYKVEQPALPGEEKSVSSGSSSKSKKAPKVVRTTPIKSPGTSTKIVRKSSGPGLSKAESGVILKALNAGNVTTVKEYLDTGMDPNVVVYGSPLLQKAANLSTAEIVKLIISRGGNLNYRSRQGNDALYQAMSNTKNWKEVITVLVEAGVKVDKKTAIWKIAFKTKNGDFKPGVKETLEYFLSKGADLNYPISKSGNTLLMFACKMAWLEPVKFYLAHGADVHAKDKNGKTALNWAETKRRGEQPFEQQNRKAIIDLLRQKRAS
jgi:ankyrin repeat protein